MQQGPKAEQPGNHSSHKTKQQMNDILGELAGPLPDFTGVAWSVASFIAGTWFGHYLSMRRDDRNRRAVAYSDLRRNILSATRPVRITATQTDAVLTVCQSLRRRSLGKAIDRCSAAAKSYYGHPDAIGQPTVSEQGAKEMEEAISHLAEQLRIK